MVLRYSIGKAASGKVCAADVAFGKFERQIDGFEMGDAWCWFVERATSLEAKLEAIGGFDASIAEQLEMTGTVIGSVGAMERYEQADYICSQIEEVAMAFVVTLQPRLNALRIAAKTIYEKAATEDNLPVAGPAHLKLPAKLKSIWDVANYVKHNDEWGTELKEQQRVAYDTLLELGVATGPHNDRELARWPTLEALLAISDETWLRHAMPSTLKLCVAGGTEIASVIQTAFAPLAGGLDAVRATNQKRMFERLKGKKD